MVSHSPGLQQTGCVLPPVRATPQRPAPTLHPFPPKPGRGPLEGAQAAAAGKPPRICFLIWKMEAVTLARGHVTRAKEENTRKLFKRNSHVNHRTFRGRRKLSQISER